MNKSPDHREYIKMMRRLSPQERLKKSFELTEFTKNLFLAGLKDRFPDLTNKEIKKYTLSGSTNVTT